MVDNYDCLVRLDTDSVQIYSQKQNNIPWDNKA